ncbi:MAG: S1 family peptidase [Deltaproteobacteria bacterium]|nr:S1 family peptidase [Deltaproteobacteria bacterium]
MARAAAVVLLVGLAACWSGQDEPSICAAREGGLAGGLAGGAWPAVGLVRVGRELCTGTLVAPRVVVSARHCVDLGTTPGEVEFLTGRQGEELEAVGSDLLWTDGEDLIAVVLDRAPSVEPAPFRTTPMAREAIGSEVTLVGYGTTRPDANDHGVKRSGTASIEVVDDLTFVVEIRFDGQAAPCFGDSGGPALLDGQVAGVLSGGDPACAGRGDVYMRFDRHVELVEEAIAASLEVETGVCR